MIAEAMAGMALVKSGVDFIKSNIQTAQDIGSFASAIDNMFAGQEQINKKRAKKASSIGVKDQLGIKSVAQEVIDAKLAQESMDEMRQLIDYRFGHGTWKTIVDERARRIKEQKEAEAAAKRAKIQAAKERDEAIKQALAVGFGIFVIAGMVIAMAYLFTMKG